MEALIIDVENELDFISREIDILKRKKAKIQTETDPDNLDSHIKAIALTIRNHGSGYRRNERMKLIVARFDRDYLLLATDVGGIKSPLHVCENRLGIEGGSR